MDKRDMYGDFFYDEEPFYRVGMSVEEFRKEKNYLNENIEAFVKGDYVPLWKQRRRKNYNNNF